MNNIFNVKTVKVVSAFVLLAGIAGTAHAVGCYGIWEMNWSSSVGYYHQHVNYWHDIRG